MAELTLNVPSIQLSQPPSSNPNNTNRKLWFACVLLGLYAFSTIGDKAEIITQGRLIIQQDKYIEFVDSRLVSATSELSGTKKDLGECRGSLSDCKTAYASCDKSLVAAQDQVKKDASTIRLRTARLKEVTELLEQEERNHTGTRNDLLVSQAERATTMHPRSAASLPRFSAALKRRLPQRIRPNFRRTRANWFQLQRWQRPAHLNCLSQTTPLRCSRYERTHSVGRRSTSSLSTLVCCYCYSSFCFDEVPANASDGSLAFNAQPAPDALFCGLLSFGGRPPLCWGISEKKSAADLVLNFINDYEGP